jgi:hypothetical protein
MATIRDIQFLQSSESLCSAAQHPRLRRPIHYQQIRHAPELACVGRDHRRAASPRLCGDEVVERADRRSHSLEKRPNIRRLACFFDVERRMLEPGRQKFIVQCARLLPAIAFRNPQKSSLNSTMAGIVRKQATEVLGVRRDAGVAEDQGSSCPLR